jgi:hypothetical protein
MPNSAYAWSVALQGNYAFVAAQAEGLQVVDVSDSQNPTIAGAFVLAGASVWDVDIEGTFAYVAAGTAGVRILDISTPGTPTEVAFVDTPDFGVAVDVAGGFLYIADSFGGLHIVNVSTPGSPALVSTHTGTLGSVENVTASGTHVILSTADAVSVVGVSDPSNPVLRRSYPTAGTPQGAAVSADGAVLVADYDGGLRVLAPTVLTLIYTVYLPLVTR